jgi:hypothetical protein
VADEQTAARLAERCDVCDRPSATEADYDAIPEGEGKHLCWREWDVLGCDAAAVDWRERYVAQASELARVTDALREYGQHKPSCILTISRSPLRETSWCDCGFAAALAAGSQEPT